MENLKSIGKFILLTLRPISKTEQAFGWWDVVNGLLFLAYPYVHFRMDLDNLFANANLVWLLVFPIIFLIIAGLKLQFRVSKQERRSIQLIYDEAICERKQWLPSVQGEPILQVIYMVGLRPTGNITLNDVEVSIISIDPIPIDSDFIRYSPCILNPLDSKGQAPSRFSVNPGKTATAFVEVLSWDSERPDEIGIHFYANYHDGVRHIPSLFSRGNYTLTLRATGRDIASCDGNFEIQMGERGLPKFKEIKR